MPLPDSAGRLGGSGGLCGKLAQMPKRTVNFREWLKLVRKHAFDDGFYNLGGLPVADVAKKLDVSTQRVYQLIADDTLDVIEVTNAKGRVCLTVITDASMSRYLERRTPAVRRPDLFSFAK